MNDQEYGGAAAWGSVWRGALLGAAIGGVIYSTYHVDEPFLENVAYTAGIGAMLTGLWAAGSGMIAAARAPRGSVQNEAATMHALVGFFSGVGGGATVLGISAGVSRPRRRRRPSSPYSMARS